jgi:hypothetical protein
MRFNDILLEYNRDQTVKNYGQKVLAAAATDRSIDFNGILRPLYPNERATIAVQQAIQKDPEAQQLIVNHVMGVIEASDPTKNKNYAQAITRLYAMGGTMLEDIESTLSQYLVKFDKLKNKKKIPAPFNDFMRYKSLNEFMTAVEAMPDPDSEVEQQKIGAIQLPPDDAWRYIYGRMDQSGRITTDCLVIQPLNEYGAYWWAKEYPKKGVTNRWCTAWEDNNSRFSYYNRQGPLFIIIPANRGFEDEKFQFHFETKQFMDYRDNQLGDQGIDALAQRFPALTNIFRNQAISMNILGLMTPEYKQAVRSHSKVASKELDSMIEQHKERIAGFGFSSLGDYGISIPEETRRDLMPLIENYLELCRAALVTKDGFWRQLVNRLGTERSEDKIEVILNTDKELKQAMEQSEAGQVVADLARTPDISRHIDASHLQDILLRDPLFRFTMRQVPKLYQKFLDELDFGQVNEGYSMDDVRRDAEANARKSIDRMTAPQEKTPFMAQVGKKIVGGVAGAVKGAYKGFTGQQVEENEDEMFSDEGFFVVIANENEGAFVGMISKDGGKWRETDVAGNAPRNWGGNYMSYLTTDDIMQHIRNDYSRGSQVKGPFDTEEEAISYAQSHFDLGGDEYDDYDDEDTLEEGGMKDIDIGRQDRDTMTAQQFRGQYKQSKDDWTADNKGILDGPAGTPAAPRKKAANTVEAYMEVYNKRDQREFKSMPFPNEKAAQRWADSHNAIIHSIAPLSGVAEQMDEPEDEVEHDDGKIAGRYQPDEFDELVNRVKAKAKEQERIHGPVDIAKLAARLRGIK